jgi:hypothetical protein
MTQIKPSPLMTPVATAGFGHVQEPDSVGDYADGKWKIQLYFDATPEFNEFREAVMAHHKGGREPFKPQEDGTFLLNPKTAIKPTVVDSRLNPITDDVYKGSRVICSVTPAPYEGGLTTYLNGVQVIELVTRSNGLAGFEVVEGGYEAEQPEFAGWVSSKSEQKAADDVPW